jgi:hypothetical protein
MRLSLVAAEIDGILQNSQHYAQHKKLANHTWVVCMFLSFLVDDLQSQSVFAGLSKKMRKPATNTPKAPAPQHPQSILVEYKQSHNVFAGLSKKMRKPLAGTDLTPRGAKP